MSDTLPACPRCGNLNTLHIIGDSYTCHQCCETVFGWREYDVAALRASHSAALERIATMEAALRELINDAEIAFKDEMGEMISWGDESISKARAALEAK